MGQMTDTIIVSFDKTHGDHSVLVIGRKLPGKPIEIINAFQDEVAENLYSQLVTPAKKEG